MRTNGNALESVPTSPPVMSPEFIKRALRFQSAPDPDETTARTVELMVSLIQRSSSDPLLESAAETALRQYKGGGPLWAMAGVDPFAGGENLRARAMAEAVWWYAKHQIKFVHHSKQIEVWLGETDQQQLLIEPSVLLRFPFQMEGDCAIYSMLIPAMLNQLGIQWELVTVAWHPQHPNIFLHVYPRAVLPNGERLALDASHGKYPGWSIPYDQRYRTAVWDQNGNNVPDAGENQVRGLHGYTRRGFGDVTDAIPVDSTPVDTTSIDYANLVSSAAAGGYDVSTGPALTPYAGGASAAVAPPQNSAQWASFANQLLKSGLTLAEINSIQPGTVVSANGAILRQATGLPVPVGSGTLTAAFGGVNSSFLLYGGLALGAIFLLSLKK